MHCLSASKKLTPVHNRILKELSITYSVKVTWLKILYSLLIQQSRKEFWRICLLFLLISFNSYIVKGSLGNELLRNPQLEIKLEFISSNRYNKKLKANPKQ